MKHGLIKVIVAVFALAANPACVHARAKKSLGPNFESRVLTSQGRDREYLLYTPSTYNSKSQTPVVIGFHGGATSNAILARTTHFHRLADEQGFLVVYPNGIDGNWNDGRGTVNNDVDDVKFVTDLIEEVKRLRNVDARRIYVTGISNGAFMVQRLACEQSNRIAAFSAVAGSMSTPLRAVCKPSKPVSIMIINSPEDKFVPYKGGEMKRGAGGSLLSVPDTVKFWSQHNGCTNTVEKALSKKYSADPSRVILRQTSGCRGGSTVVQYIIEGSGHTWPGGQDQPPWLVGPTSEELNATTESWNFFKGRILQ